MSLGADMAHALTELRAQAESAMTATCVVTRPGAVTFNPVTLQNDASAVTVYTGPCGVREAGQQAQAGNAGDQSFTEGSHVLSLPVAGSEGIRKGDAVEVTAADDAGLVGRKFTVNRSSAQSHAAKRRLPVTETQ